MHEAAHAVLATPSSLSSYPTYTPPPPLPRKADAVSPLAVPPSPPTAEAKTATSQRTFHEECNELLRVMNEDAEGGVACVGPKKMREKCRAILSEVEHLNRLLEVTVEERDDMEGELRGQLLHAEMTIREQTQLLEERNEELLHLRGAVAQLTARLEVAQQQQKQQPQQKQPQQVPRTDSRDADDGRGSRGGDDGVGRASGIISAPVVEFSDEAHDNDRDVTRNNNGDGKEEEGDVCVNVGTEGVAIVCRVAQNALRWVKFLLGRCVSDGAEDDGGNTAPLLPLLHELQQRIAGPDVDAAAVRVLCVQLSNGVAEAAAVRAPSARCDAHVREEKLRQQVAALEAERDALRQRASVVAEENVLLLRELKACEYPAQHTTTTPPPPLPAQMSQLEVQNAMLLAERDRQAVFIEELEQQLRQLEEEKIALHSTVKLQAESLQRHECALEFLSRHEFGGGGRAQTSFK